MILKKQQLCRKVVPKKQQCIPGGKGKQQNSEPCWPAGSIEKRTKRQSNCAAALLLHCDRFNQAGMAKLMFISLIVALLLLQSKGLLQRQTTKSTSTSSRSLSTATSNGRKTNNAFLRNALPPGIAVLADKSALVNSEASRSITAAALNAIAKLLSTCGIGVWASNIGLLDKAALGVLSKLIFGLLQPSLLFVNVASTVAKLRSTGGGSSVYILPITAAIQILMGYAIGRIITFFLYGRKQSDDSRELLTCVTFANSGPLPLVFVDALLRNHANPAYLPQSVGFISLYLLGWSPLFWIFAPAILSDGGDQGKKTDWKVVMNRILSPPVLGSLMGIIVGSSKWLSGLLVDSRGLLNPAFEALRTLGAGYLPAVLLVLAGSLNPTAPATATSAAAAAGAAKALQVDWNYVKQIMSIYLARFCLIPLAGFAALKYVKRAVPSLATVLSDPVLCFVLLLECAMPSAQNSTVILNLFKKDPSRMARILLAVYVLGVPAISFWLVQILKFTAI